MEKIDLFKQHKTEYGAGKEPRTVTVGEAQYLSISGQGEPGGDAFQTAIGALYGMAYTTKMASKMAGQDYVVCKLESRFTSMTAWQLLIRTPGFIDAAALDASRDKLRSKDEPAPIEQVGLVTIDEGPCVQLLHIGPYRDEQRSVDRIMAFVDEQGWTATGQHHEIYLSDPRRTAPEKLKTILRYPIQK